MTRVAAIRLPGGAPGIRLACLARPVRLRQGRRDPHLASSGRRAPAPDQETEAVPGRPGDPGRAGPADAQRPAPPAPADHLPADPAALARPAGPAALDLPAPRTGPAQDSIGDTGAGTGDGAGQPAGDTGASTANWPGWDTSWRRRRSGRSSRTQGSIPHPGGPRRPGGSSWTPGPRRSLRRTCSTSTPCCCGACTY
jgi:hypothetical protein